MRLKDELLIKLMHCDFLDQDLRVDTVGVVYN